MCGLSDCGTAKALTCTVSDAGAITAILTCQANHAKQPDGTKCVGKSTRLFVSMRRVGLIKTYFKSNQI